MKKIAIALFLLVLVSPANAVIWNVNVANFTFAPTPVTIGLGDTVRWTWISGVHTTTSDPGQLESWDSGVLSSGTYDHTFSNPGSFRYYCTLHGGINGQGMAGVVNVNAVPEPGSLPALGSLVGVAGGLGLRRRSRCIKRRAVVADA